jgi:PD-(D/E)XK endonuclease
VRHPKEIGDRSTLAIMFAFQLHRWEIYVPFGENTRCDLIVDGGTGLKRIQCKTGRLRNGAVLFATCSTYGHHPNPKVLKRNYIGEIDDFGVYCEQVGAVYIVPVEDVPPTGIATLRVTPPRNNQSQGVRLAAAYEFARFDVF